MNLYQHAKNQAISLIDPKNFWVKFNFANLYQHPKKWGYFINLFRRNSWFKYPAIWLAESTFLSISQEQDFSQILDLCSNTTNNINFYDRANSVKTNNQIFLWIQKPILAHFPNFCSKKNPAVTHNLISTPSTMAKFREIWTGSRTEGQMNPIS